MSSQEHDAAEKKIGAFLAAYKTEVAQRVFQLLGENTKRVCQAILKKMDIPGVVTYRVKTIESLETKLNTMKKNPTFAHWLSLGHDLWLHPDMCDLAGVRVGVSFPQDIPRISKGIAEVLTVQHIFGTVTSNREAVQGKNFNIDLHNNGEWRSHGSNGVVDYWHSSGYKSWQMVIVWDQEPINDLGVEVQVGTASSQAYGEAEHYIIYKKPNPNEPLTPNMKQALEILSSLSNTTEDALRVVGNERETPVGAATKTNGELLESLEEIVRRVHA